MIEYFQNKILGWKNNVQCIYTFSIFIQLTWRVDYNFDRPQATRGLDDLEEKVKLGDIRATLVVQDKEDYADITLNAGTKQEA